MCAVNTFKIAMAIGFATLAFVQTSRAADEPLISLVRARVTGIADVKPDQSMTATLEIEHVYAGDKELKGRTFHDYYVTSSGSFGVDLVLTPFQVGHEGIWTLQWVDFSINKSDPKLYPTRDKLMPFGSRYRKAEKGRPRYAQIVALAEAVEAVEAAEPADRVPKLRELLADRTPEVAAWAVRKLAATAGDAARKVLDELASKPDLDLPMATQVSLDEVLGISREKAWYESKVRRAMLESWVAGKPDVYHAGLILTRFHFAAQGSAVPQTYYVKLLQAAVGNAHWPLVARLRALEQVGTTAGLGRGTYDESTYEWLLAYLKGDGDVAFRRAAASGLYGMRLNPAHIEALDAQRVLETDRQVVSTLKYAIQASHEPRLP